MSYIRVMFWIDEEEAQVLETALEMLMSESIRSLGSDDTTQTGDELIELMKTHTVARALLSKTAHMRKMVRETSEGDYLSEGLKNFFSGLEED